MYCTEGVIVLQVSYMAETKSRSIRVEDALWERFCAISGTQNDVFRKLLDGEVRTDPDLGQKIYERTGRIENMVEELVEMGQSVPVAAQVASPVERTDPGAIAGVSVGVSKAPVVIKRYRCDHCGVSLAVARVGEICENCREGRHFGEARDCPRCTTDYGTGAL